MGIWEEEDPCGSPSDSEFGFLSDFGIRNSDFFFLLHFTLIANFTLIPSPGEEANWQLPPASSRRLRMFINPLPGAMRCTIEVAPAAASLGGGAQLGGGGPVPSACPLRLNPQPLS